MPSKPASYLGVPQEEWDDLLLQAEDLLRDKDIGQYIVGIYPAGPRIFGLEHEPPGIMCLYVDSVETLINPVIVKHSNPIQHQRIWLYDLYKWVRQIPLGIEEIMAYAVPMGDIIYQDESISEIVSTARLCLKATHFNYGITKHEPMIPYKYYDLLNRVKFILAATGKFLPCTNPQYGKVYKLPANFDSLTLGECFDKITSTEIPPELEHLQENLTKLGKLTADLYRYQL